MNNNEEKCFDNFQEYMIILVQEKEYEIACEKKKLLSLQSTLNKNKKIDGLFTAGFAGYLFLVYYASEYSPISAFALLLSLFILKSSYHHFYLDALEEYLQQESKMQAKIAEKESLLTICYGFGIELEEPEENKKGR